jgi:DNA polymerase
MAACAPFLRRQAEALDPSVVVTLGRFSMATFMPGVRISQAHGTTRQADPETGAHDATVFAMYHPAYALRNPSVERESYDDAARIPGVLTEARDRRRAAREARAAALVTAAPAAAAAGTPARPADAPAVAIEGVETTPDDQLSLF